MDGLMEYEAIESCEGMQGDFFFYIKREDSKAIRAIAWGMGAIPQRLWERVGTPFDCPIKP